MVCYGSTTRNEMLFKIYDYLWENSKYFNSLSVEQMNELYNSVLEYAKTLVPKFSDPDMGQYFFTFCVNHGFEGIPTEEEKSKSLDK